MTLRRQLPAYSPLPFGAVAAGALGLVAGGHAARGWLERELTARYGATGVLLTDSGTSALSLAIAAALRDAGDAPVAVPAWSCYDIATAVLGARARAALYDLDPVTLTPDEPSLRAALDRGARAVVLVHLYGIPANPEQARDMAHAAGAAFIEDAAQGAGASWRGSRLGRFGDLAVLSFGRGKGNTGGRGGALLAHGARGDAMLAWARERLGARSGGMTEALQLAAQWLLGRPAWYGIPSAIPTLRLGETIFHAPHAPQDLSDVAARTLKVTFPLGDAEAERRRGVARRFLGVRGGAFAPIRIDERAVPGYLRLPLLRAGGRAPELGIMSGYPLALCDLPGFEEAVVNRDEPFAGARRLASDLITVPVHSRLTRADQARIEGWLAH